MNAIKFIQNFKEKLCNHQEGEYEQLVIDAFHFQRNNNIVYKKYLSLLPIDVEKINDVAKIPFLPIQFFKNFRVVSNPSTPKLIFESSGTTGSIPSKHYIFDPEFYLKVSEKIFNTIYGDLSQYQILGLLPSYLERSNSSLVFMLNHFINKSKSLSGFYLNEYEALSKCLKEINKKDPCILWGVSFAFLDLVENGFEGAENVLCLETGGMKGRRKEMIRTELHQIIQGGLNTGPVHSEYGMTELLSQAYAQKDGLFQMHSLLQIWIRDLQDPFSIQNKESQGGINVIDLANIDSCCFIETQDIGRIVSPTQTFEVLGRMDSSEIRGCNLLVQ